MSRLQSLINLASRTTARRYATSVMKTENPQLAKIKKKQAHFQVDNEVPVFLKGGTSDVILYYTTLGLTVYGVGLSIYSIYRMAVKDK